MIPYITKQRFKYLLAAVLYVCTLSGCEFRALSYDYADQINVQVNIDWSEVKGYTPQYLKAIFYPVGGGTRIERSIEPEGEGIALPEGEYNVILYNWRANSDGQTIQFRGVESFTTLQAYTGLTRSQVHGMSRADVLDEPIIAQPDSLYAWSSYTTGTFKVSKAIAAATVDHIIRLNTKPQSLVQHHWFDVEIKGMEYIRKTGALVTGNAQSVKLYSGEITSYSCSIPFDIIYDENKLICNFTTLGLLPGSMKQTEWVFTLPDGTKHEEVIDVSESVEGSGTIKNHDPIEIKYSGVIDGGAFDPPGVVDWDVIEEDIPMTP